MTQGKIKVVKSSAGSGKTYTLAREYLSFALKNPNSFKRILAVTFTNKATAEMKERILSYTAAFAKGKGDDGMRHYFKEQNQWNDEQLNKQAGLLLKAILHDYTQFNISTIDSFFQRIVRAFARDYNLPANYQIELNGEIMLEEVIDDFFADEALKKEVKEHLMNFTKKQLVEKNKWDIRNDLKQFAKNMLYLTNDEVLRELNQIEDPISLFKEIDTVIKPIIQDFETTLKEIGQRGEQSIINAGYIHKDFSRSRTTVFQKWQDKDYEIIKTYLDLYDGLIQWGKGGKKPTQEQIVINDFGSNKLQPLLMEGIDYIKEYYQSYKTALLIDKNLAHFSILIILNKRFQEYKLENEILLNSDNTKFLNEIIATQEDAPFLYEKTSTFFKHYLIDEFQDTAPNQWINFKPLLLETLSNNNGNLIVGDVKQSIYRFRGGDWQLLNDGIERSFDSKHQLEHHVLDTNYRSATRIIETVGAVFDPLIKKIEEHFEEDFSEKYLATAQRLYKDVSQKISKAREQSKDKGFVKIQFFEDDKDNEVSWKDQAIAHAIQSFEEAQLHKVSPHHICFLVRKAKQGQEFVNAINQYVSDGNAKKGVSYQVISQDSLFIGNAQAVQILLASIRLMVSADELNKQSLGFLLKEFKGLDRNKKEEKLLFTKGEEDLFDTILDKLDHLRPLPLHDAMEELIGYWNLLEIEDERLFLESFVDVVYDYTRLNYSSPSGFLDYWNTEGFKKKIKGLENTEAMELMTIHKSKGLQYHTIIVPFLDWNMHETSYQLSPILWLKTVQKPFAAFPFLPIKYSSKLEESYFKPQYYEEKFQQIIENVNLFYVTITRAADAVLIYGFHKPRKKSNKDSKSKNISDWLRSALQNHDDLKLNFNSETNIFEIGSWKDVMNLPVGKDDGMKSKLVMEYPKIYDWQDKVQVREQSISDIENEEYDNVLGASFGLIVHEVLSKVLKKEDLEKELQERISSGSISSQQLLKLQEMMYNIFQNEEIASYFSNDQTDIIKTEIPIIVPGGQLMRIDRLHISKDKKYAMIIDYKTGDSENKELLIKYRNQINKYKTEIKKMGFEKVVGRLIHLETAKLEVV